MSSSGNSIWYLQCNLFNWVSMLLFRLAVEFNLKRAGMFLESEMRILREENVRLKQELAHARVCFAKRRIVICCASYLFQTSFKQTSSIHRSIQAIQMQCMFMHCRLWNMFLLQVWSRVRLVALASIANLIARPDRCGSSCDGARTHAIFRTRPP